MQNYLLRRLRERDDRREGLDAVVLGDVDVAPFTPIVKYLPVDVGGEIQPAASSSTRDSTIDRPGWTRTSAWDREAT
jgi:hypothetical protein